MAVTNRCTPTCDPRNLRRETWDTGYRDTCVRCGFTVAIYDDEWALEPPGGAHTERMVEWFRQARAEGRVSVGTSVIPGAVRQ